MRVIVPIVWPGITTTALFTLLLAYNKFLLARLLTATNSTLPVGISRYTSGEAALIPLSQLGLHHAAALSALSHQGPRRQRGQRLNRSIAMGAKEDSTHWSRTCTKASENRTGNMGPGMTCSGTVPRASAPCAACEFDIIYRKPFTPPSTRLPVIRIAQGDWAAGTGYQTTTFAQDWLGIPAHGRQIKMRYMDFWRAEERDGVPSWPKTTCLSTSSAYSNRPATMWTRC